MLSLRLAAAVAACLIAAPAASQDAQKAPAERKCTTNSQCERSEFCSTSSCDASATGICKKKPSVCTNDAIPAMGCDGKSYANACRVHAAGINIKASR